MSAQGPPKMTWASLAPPRLPPLQAPTVITFPKKNTRPLNTPGLNKNNPMWGKFNPTLVTRGFAKNFSLRKGGYRSRNRKHKKSKTRKHRS
jgi:hypothetical protein